MKHKPAIISAVFFFLSLVAGAQEKKIIGLQEAIELGLKNSKVLKSGQAKVDESAAALQEAIEKKLPSASASASYLRLSSANFDLKTKTNSSSSGSGDQPSVNQAMYGIVNLSMPIFQGGKIRYGIESARFLQKAAQLDEASQKDEVIQNTIEAFANLFKANTAIRLVKENLDQSHERERELANLEKNGLLARNDLMKAQLQTSNVELALLDAQNNLDIANLNMNLMLGLAPETQLSLDTTGIERKEDSRVMEDYIQLAYNSRKDISALDYRKKAAESNVKSTQADKYPSMQLTGGYIAADVPHVFSVTNAVNIGVGISYNVSSLWKTKSKVQQAEARVKQYSIQQSLLDDNVRLQVSKNYYSLLSYRKKIEVYVKTMEQAKENYRIVKNKFNNSLATLSDLLEADVAQLQATMGYTLARADAFVAYHKLLQSAGVLSTEPGK